MTGRLNADVSRWQSGMKTKRARRGECNVVGEPYVDDGLKVKMESLEGSVYRRVMRGMCGRLGQTLLTARIGVAGQGFRTALAPHIYNAAPLVPTIPRLPCNNNPNSVVVHRASLAASAKTGLESELVSAGSCQLTVQGDGGSTPATTPSLPLPQQCRAPS